MKIKIFFFSLFLVCCIFFSVSSTQATNCFVKVEGSGDKSGSSWDNAMDLECFRTAVHDQAIDGDVFYLAGGLYQPNESTALQRDHLDNDNNLYFLSIKEKGISLIGGFDPNITGRKIDITYPTKTPTIFSGDRNNNGVVDDGDCRILYIRANNNYDKKITLKGLTIRGGYQPSSADRKPGVSVATGSKVDILYCTFENNNNPTPDSNSNAGGSALSVRDHSDVYCYKCLFVNNVSHNRGGAIRCQGGAGGNNTLILESCYITGSSCNTFGGAIQATHADVYMVNTTVTGNSVKKGAVLNGSASWYFVNSTIADNECTEDKDYGYDFRCETRPSYIFNSIIVNSADDNNIKLEDNTLVSGGFNLLGKVGGAGSVSISTGDVLDLLFPAVFGANVAEENDDTHGIKTIAVQEDKPGATLAQITDYIENSADWYNVKSRLSADWNTKDARGALRPKTDPVTIGAYQYGGIIEPSGIENTQAIGYSVYPSVVNDILNIETEGNIFVSIIDIMGKTFYSDVCNGKTLISTNRFPKGLYLVKTGEHTTKIIKQ